MRRLHDEFKKQQTTFHSMNTCMVIAAQTNGFENHEKNSPECNGTEEMQQVRHPLTHNMRVTSLMIRGK